MYLREQVGELGQAVQTDLGNVKTTAYVGEPFVAVRGSRAPLLCLRADVRACPPTFHREKIGRLKTESTLGLPASCLRQVIVPLHQLTPNHCSPLCSTGGSATRSRFQVGGRWLLRPAVRLPLPVLSPALWPCSLPAVLVALPLSTAAQYQKGPARLEPRENVRGGDVPQRRRPVTPRRRRRRVSQRPIQLLFISMLGWSRATLLGDAGGG